MTTELTLVRVGMNMEEATIVKWHKQVGETFAEGETVYSIETDKVTYDVEASFGGRLLEIKVPEGQVAAVGAVVALAGQVETSGG
jgi:pyruvate/2-oxoglutarate dehydrogenase complex dihydrolipoamide acyltransferase (E2) component